MAIAGAIVCISLYAMSQLTIHLPKLLVCPFFYVLNFKQFLFPSYFIFCTHSELHAVDMLLWVLLNLQIIPHFDMSFVNGVCRVFRLST